MKKLLLSILISFISLSLISQSCLPEGITFTSQAQIDSFQIMYPNCTEIEGTVYIGGEVINDIENLNGLNVITSIGHLIIAGADSLESLQGLENLNTVEEVISLGSNYGWCSGNAMLSDITALSNLTTIGDGLVICGSIFSNLEGLENIELTPLNHEIFITENPFLSNCEIQNICEFLAYPNSSSTIYGNAPGCNSQEEVEEACSSCLPEGIEFTTQEQIDNFQINYPNCNEIEGGVVINGEDITNLDSLIVLTSIDGNLNIGWWMYQNPSLISLEGLNNLTYVGGSLRIDRNALLVDLTGLDHLTTIGGELRIGTCWSKNQNPDYIVGNPSLKNLLGLKNLTSLEGGVMIECNDSLTSLEGLENIDAGSITGLILAHNVSLSTCEVQSICDYLVSPGGEIYISDNSTGCTSQEEVEEACASSVYEYGGFNKLTISPNPFNTSATLSYELKQPENVYLSIYNHLGQLIYQTKEIQPQGKQQLIWNTEGYADGIYYYRLQVGDKVANGKMVKAR